MGKVFFAFIDAWIAIYLVILSPLDAWIKAIIGLAALLLSIDVVIQVFKKILNPLSSSGWSRLLYSPQ